MPLPTPIPSIPMGNPAEWNRQQLVEIVTTSGSTKVFSEPSFRGGQAFAPASNRRINQNDRNAMGAAENSFANVGPDFTKALFAAHRETMLSTDSKNNADWSATAVLQGGDGAYYIAPLGYNSNGSYRGAFIDGANAGTLRDVRALVGDVRAVVGGASWVNFTQDQTTFDPNLPAPPA